MNPESIPVKNNEIGVMRTQNLLDVKITAARSAIPKINDIRSFGINWRKLIAC